MIREEVQACGRPEPTPLDAEKKLPSSKKLAKLGRRSVKCTGDTASPRANSMLGRRKLGRERWKDLGQGSASRAGGRHN
jgi:hypothetical protein